MLFRAADVETLSSPTTTRRRPARSSRRWPTSASSRWSATRVCFVNVTREFILSEFATLLPADRVALELGRTDALDLDVRAKLVELREKGYQIVLDDFVLREDSEPLLARR